MLLESMGILIPSEAISPFAGYLVSREEMTLFGAVAAGVLGNLVGSWVAYFIGLWGGRELWFHYGRLVGVRAHHLAVAEKWFDRYGEFTVYTFVGCVPWIFALTYFGYYLGENWDEVGAYLHYLDYAVALGVLTGAFYLFLRWRSSRPSSRV